MRRLVVLVALLLVAQSATAQMGGGMGGGGRRGGMGGRGGMGNRGSMERGNRTQNMKFPSAKTLEKYNPAALMLDKHKKLKLDDAQQGRLKEMRVQIFERNAMLLGRYDSLQRDFRPPQLGLRGNEGPSPAADSARRVSMMQMRQLRLLVDSLQDRRRNDVQRVLTVLVDDTQRKKAAELLDKQDIKFGGEFPAPPAQRGPAGEGSPDGSGGFGRGGRRPPA